MRKSSSLGQFISKSTLIAILVVLVLPTAWAASATGAQKAGKALLKSRRAVGSIDRITVKLDAGGELKFVEDKKVDSEKMSVVAELDYSERTLALPKSKSAEGKNAKKVRFRSVRYYDTAKAVIKVGDSGFNPTLRDERRLIGISVDGCSNKKPEPEAKDTEKSAEETNFDNANVIFSPMGPLTREELDLLEIYGDSLLLDRLLPDHPVAIGDTWNHPEALMQALLCLDRIAKCDVKSTLEKLTSTSALIVANGQVEGAIGGVSIRKTIKAKYRFNRRTGRIDWFGLLVKEGSDIGHINTGVDQVARVQMQIKQVKSSSHLSDAALKGFSIEPSEEMRQLVHSSASGGWEFSYDRHWFVTVEQSSRSVLRMVESGELIAQCNITTLAKVKPGKQITLTHFQNDIKKALGDNFGEFINASQSASESNYRVLRVVVGGESSDLPVCWIYYLIADEQGRQVTLTFTVEQTHVERLANADRALVETLRFIEPKVALHDGKEVQR